VFYESRDRDSILLELEISNFGKTFFTQFGTITPPFGYSDPDKIINGCHVFYRVCLVNRQLHNAERGSKFPNVHGKNNRYDANWMHLRDKVSDAFIGNFVPKRITSAAGIATIDGPKAKIHHFFQFKPEVRYLSIARQCIIMDSFFIQKVRPESGSEIIFWKVKIL